MTKCCGTCSDDNCPFNPRMEADPPCFIFPYFNAEHFHWIEATDSVEQVARELLAIVRLIGNVDDRDDANALAERLKALGIEVE